MKLKLLKNIIITDHAKEKYRTRLNPDASDNEILEAIKKVAHKVKAYKKKTRDGTVFVCNEIVFAAIVTKNKVLVTTIFGTKQRYKWEKHYHNKNIMKAAI